MDESALQSLASEFIRQLAGAGLWWLAVLAAFAFALLVVGLRRGWLKPGPVAPPDPQPDVGGPDAPDAEWDSNVGQGIKDEDRPPG